MIKNYENLPNSKGIYLIKNSISGKVYVGQANDIFKRVRYGHIIEYKNPNNCCYNTKFYKALRKYGLENFEVSVLEELNDNDNLDEKEIEYIAKYDSFVNGYNSTKGGQHWSPNIHSAETEQKREITRQKNKSLQSENHPRARLTNQQVWDIRQRYIDGEDMNAIYEDFKELYPSIRVFRRIVLGETYVSVGNIPSKEDIRHTNAKLTSAQIKEIRARHKKGDITFRALGKEYGVSATSISAIVSRQTYKHID